jgi:hypothetical protein
MTNLLLDLSSQPGRQWEKAGTDILSSLADMDLMCFASSFLSSAEFLWNLLQNQDLQKKVQPALLFD